MCQFLYPFRNQWIFVSSFAYYEKSCSKHSFTGFCMDIFYIFLGLISKNLQSECTIASHQQCVSSSCSACCEALGIVNFCLIDFSHVSSYVVASYGDFNMNFPNGHWWRASCLFEFFWLFICSNILMFFSSLHIINTKLSSGVCLQASSHTLWIVLRNWK